jgi:hypothetical protein
MAAQDAAFWKRADLARDKLKLRLSDRPEVSLIDIGLDPQDSSDTGAIFLRVHLRKSASLAELGLPAEIDGIPVMALHGDYHLE